MSSAISSAAGILAIWNDVHSGREADFERWYNTEHLTERIAVPGFRLGRRYAALHGTPRYFCWYRVDTPEVLTSPAYLARLNDPTPLTRRVMTEVVDGMIRTVCRQVSARGRLYGAYSVTARFEMALRHQEARAGLDACAGLPGVARCEHWSAAGTGSTAATEEQLRGGDRRIADALLVDALRAEDADVVARWLAAHFGARAAIGIYRLLCEVHADT